MKNSDLAPDARERGITSSNRDSDGESRLASPASKGDGRDPVVRDFLSAG
jgi:hypothetical protein